MKPELAPPPVLIVITPSVVRTAKERASATLPAFSDQNTGQSPLFTKKVDRAMLDD